MRSTVPLQTTHEFVRSLLGFVDKFKATLEAADKLFRIDEDMIADGGDPISDPLFDEPDDVVDGKWNPPCGPEENPEESPSESPSPEVVGKVVADPVVGWTTRYAEERRQEERRQEERQKLDLTARGGDTEEWPQSNVAPSPADGTPRVARKQRAPVLHRAVITDQIEEEIIHALVNRDPHPRMQDLAAEYSCSQSTISRIWKKFQESRKATETEADE